MNKGAPDIGRGEEKCESQTGFGRPRVWAVQSVQMERDEDDSPFTTRQFAAVIDGQHTEFFLSGYENRYFFVISQLGKLGTLVRTAL